ncbi:hypothetical protein NDU88_002627 [Pleurodeles waltl]|uniref:Uncharacterized protein n=1 Tax=Pleurodeles waltl TaxID=8319 RepID=A0AAV7T2F8_PLEWA|nr:hypothetical protein NDU88_002627 [Pleurodeles waltl]
MNASDGEGLAGGAESRHRRATDGAAAVPAEWTDEPQELRGAAHTWHLDLPDFKGEIRRRHHGPVRYAEALQKSRDAGRETHPKSADQRR